MKHLLTLLVPFAVHANEAQVACDLERSRAEVQARVAEAPVAFGSVGDNTTSEKNIVLGISQSFSGLSRGSFLRQAAEAKCEAIRANVALEQHARWSADAVQRDGARAELRLVEEAIALAKENISQLDAQLSAQTITISEHTAARHQLVSLENRESELRRILAKTVPVLELQNNTAIVTRAREAEANAARLSAEAQASQGWDVVLSSGVRSPLGTNSLTPFAAIAIRYSFGYSGAKDAARRVGDQTAAVLAAQQGGHTQMLIRQRQEIESLIQVETQNSATNARQLRHLEIVLASIQGIDTALGQNTARSLRLQILLIRADAAGSDARLAGLKLLLETVR